MSRYIDIETIKPRQYENSEVELGVLAYDYDEVNAMPFLDIVQCQECKHWRNTNAEKIPTASIACGNMHADDFCSYGEREDE